MIELSNNGKSKQPDKMISLCISQNVASDAPWPKFNTLEGCLDGTHLQPISSNIAYSRPTKWHAD